MQLAQLLGKPYREGFVKNRYVGRTFIMPGQGVRKKSVRQKLNAIESRVQGPQRAAGRRLDRARHDRRRRSCRWRATPARARSTWPAAAPPVRYPNVYGIDMPTTDELVAHGRTIEEIREFIGADALIYQDVDGDEARRRRAEPEARRLRGLVLRRRLRHRRHQRRRHRAHQCGAGRSQEKTSRDDRHIAPRACPTPERQPEDNACSTIIASAPASPRRRPASSTSAHPHGAVSLGVRAPRAATSSCASRTPTSSARRRTSVDAILESMRWLGLDHDEGPFYQMQRLDRYSEVVAADARRRPGLPLLLTRAELDAMREAQMAARRKAALRRPLAARARQDAAAGAGGRAAGGALPQSARRASSPGTTWSRAASRSATTRLDDLVIVRADGMPTYNFASSSTTGTWRITHVIRGDEHVNNTPRQINIFHALGRAAAGVRATCRSILGDDGREAVASAAARSVTAVRRRGLPARGDGQLPGAPGLEPRRRRDLHARAVRRSGSTAATWAKSPAQFDAAKLRWVNAHT